MSSEKTFAEVIDEIEIALYRCRIALEEVLAEANARGIKGGLPRRLDDALYQVSDAGDQLALASDEQEGELRAEAMPLPDAMNGLYVETPLGTLAARYEGERGIRDRIVVELQKPDGTCGDVCIAEVVSGEAETGYPTRLRTFAFNGRDVCPAARTDLDIDGEEMGYPSLATAPRPPRPRADGLGSEVAGGIDLDAESKDMCTVSYELDGAAKHGERGAR